ncbi:SDR family NAD(P)-dependent oxidoreductase [Lactococcus piscium]|uniref:Alcohol dehydrogenase n=1 Tax=Pseudolactococcus paracarnosus TaxID=2749962 RepID=A0A7L4WHQ3_9LACT|nr:SDR family NAD(P)-dependent oxidoreductase [Lactococcus paracarnosus]MCJ1993328.1 SDR family NAD(P)-dependent oxidoreductase [Lactococcus paracarnosus]QDJ28702.1 alcohol dehydrogenase [Lactococcus paracarnosus]SPC37305.1 Glucose 1-dehydrogenase [Lactococcus piscium]
MEKKIIVILGGTSGVGKAIAQSFNKDEAHVIIVGRSEIKAQAIISQAQAHIDFVGGDLTDFQAQQDVVNQIGRYVDHVDVLIDTFGVFPNTPQVNIRQNLQVHAEVIQLLIPLLAKSKQARLALVTGHQLAIKLSPICERQDNTIARGIWEITHKTLLMTLLAAVLSSKNMMANSFYPGEVQSELMSWTKNLSNQTVSVGRFLALSDTLDDVTGKMFDQFGQEISLPQPYHASNSKAILAPYFRDSPTIFFD